MGFQLLERVVSRDDERRVAICLCLTAQASESQDISIIMFISNRYVLRIKIRKDDW